MLLNIYVKFINLKYLYIFKFIILIYFLYLVFYYLFSKFWRKRYNCFEKFICLCVRNFIFFFCRLFSILFYIFYFNINSYDYKLILIICKLLLFISG